VCTLILAWRVFDDAPVAVAANRDEAIDRPSSPPHAWDGRPPVVAPQDERAGGTWIGHNASGVLVGVSNRWSDRSTAGERSRGLLVADLLGSESADAAVEATRAAVEAHDYDGFNLLVADAEAAYLLEWGGEFETTRLEPGVHVLMNAGFDHRFRTLDARPEAADGQARAAAWILDELDPAPLETADEWLDRAVDVLADHEHGVCVHGDGYGTQSSSLIALASDGTATFSYADGPPCRTAFETVEGQS